MDNAIYQVEKLPFWTGPVVVEPLSGGITNTNFKVEHGGKYYVVRLGEDIPVHGVMRFNEANASQAAFKAGISPEILYCSPEALIMDFIDGETLTSDQMRNNTTLEKVIPVLKNCHDEIPKHLNAGSLFFWVFQVNRNYAGTLKEDNSEYISLLPRLMNINHELEKAVGRVTMAFCHNDMLAANFIQQGEKIWLIDWDYGGFNSPLFDLANLSANISLSEEQEIWLLENYFEAEVNAKIWRSFNAMKCASALRESMWSMVSEHHSTIDFDFKNYTKQNLEVFETAYKEYKAII
ncbi:phosphotransferase [Parasalinivibrio latis]|uniref:phosphotransferase n=1 Tax=Parasalinivibrio latis TaxID=2952610 RepID=UPI0030E31E28